MNRSRPNRKPPSGADAHGGAARNDFNAKAQRSQRPQSNHMHFLAPLRPSRLCVLREWWTAPPVVTGSANRCAARPDRGPFESGRALLYATTIAFNAKAQGSQRPQRILLHFLAPLRPSCLCVLREWWPAPPAMNRSARRCAPKVRRRGLAPLELVLAIPILLFVVGLSVIFGAVACWRMRGQLAARDAVWSTRHPRWGTGVPEPIEWAPPAVRRWRAGGNIAALEHQAFQHPVIRGPLPNNLQVN